MTAGRAAPTVATIDALLPQTQCGQCGYAGCWPYAEALARGEADINRCPPGGDPGVHALATLLEREPKPLDPACGEPKPTPTVVWIDESACIGCTKCIQACPVDAIVGARRLMHTVLQDECTGCDLCVDPCPVDCIHVRPVERPWPDRRRADIARERYRLRQQRLQREAAEKQARRRRPRQATADTTAGGSEKPSLEQRRAVIAAALARSRAKKAQRRSERES
jgi:electron transport complex protein RnfB